MMDCIPQTIVELRNYDYRHTILCRRMITYAANEGKCTTNPGQRETRWKLSDYSRILSRLRMVHCSLAEALLRCRNNIVIRRNRELSHCYWLVAAFMTVHRILTTKQIYNVTYSCQIRAKASTLGSVIHGRGLCILHVMYLCLHDLSLFTPFIRRSLGAAPSKQNTIFSLSVQWTVLISRDILI